MGNANDKLAYIDGTKTAIKTSLQNAGIPVAETDTFRSYASKIDRLGELLTPETELSTYVSGLTTPLSVAQLSRLNTFIKSLKTGMSITNISDAFDWMYILGGETAESSLKNIAKDDHHGTPIANPVFTAFEGFKGDGISQYIDPDYVPNTDKSAMSLNSASAGVYSRTDDLTNALELGVIDGNNSFYLGYSIAGTAYASINSAAGNLSVALNPAISTELLIGNRKDSNAIDLYYNNNLLASSTPAPTSALSASKMFLLGRSNGNVLTQPSKKQIAFAFVGRTLSRNDVIIISYAFEAYLESIGKTLVLKDANVIFEGDSRTWGLRLPEVTASNIPSKKYTLVNNAVNGSNIEQMIERATFVDSLLQPDKVNILNVWCGYNINDGELTPEGKYVLLAEYCAARKAAGWKVNVCSEIDGQLFTYPAWHTDYITLNTLIRANWTTFADSMTDLGADARLQNALDTTYYSADKVHPNATGNAVIASLIAPNILALT